MTKRRSRTCKQREAESWTRWVGLSHNRFRRKEPGTPHLPDLVRTSFFFLIFVDNSSFSQDTTSTTSLLHSRASSRLLAILFLSYLKLAEQLCFHSGLVRHARNHHLLALADLLHIRHLHSWQLPHPVQIKLESEESAMSIGGNRLRSILGHTCEGLSLAAIFGLVFAWLCDMDQWS